MPAARIHLGCLDLGLHVVGDAPDQGIVPVNLAQPVHDWGDELDFFVAATGQFIRAFLGVEYFYGLLHHVPKHELHRTVFAREVVVTVTFCLLHWRVGLDVHTLHQIEGLESLR